MFQDCSGVWDGSAVEDECGVCDGDNSTCLDCAGTPNGAAYTNECGDCVTELDPTCVQDCSGVWDGTAVEDECGVCNGDNSTCSDCASEHLMGLQVLTNVVYALVEILELNRVFKIVQVIGVEQLLKMYVEYVMDLVTFMNVVVQILPQVHVIVR